MSKKQYTPAQEKFIQQRVKALQEWGYPGCNEENIFTDFIYSRFFSNDIDNIIYEAEENGIFSVVEEMTDLKNKIKPDEIS